LAVTIDLSDRAALVTGAGAGIGAEIAIWLARAGARVAVADIRPEKVEKVVATISDTGGTAIGVVADCRDDAQIDRMVQETVDQLGGLGIAVNNIGMMAGRGATRFVDMDGEFWRDLVDQNLVLTALCARAEAKVMLDRGRGGVILNVSSGETTRPSPYMGAYGAAKAGINHLTQTMAVELGPAGIRVVAIAPGTTLTETVRAVFDDQRVASIKESNPLRVMTEPEELGRLAVFLASDLARCITGQLILADAGAHLSRTRPPNLGPGSS
jgi:3-oxoacyl-[acyl-carrier protein] reductase